MGALAPSATGQKGSKPKVGLGGHQKTNLANSLNKTLCRMKYWQTNYPSWYQVLQLLKKSEVQRELETPWCHITDQDGANWLLKAKAWYKEDHPAMPPTGKMINFLLHYVALQFITR